MQNLKALSLPALLFFLLVMPQHAGASDWIEVAENSSGWVWFIDLDSIQADRYNDCATVWEKTVYPDSSYELTLCTYDFSDRTYRDIAIYEYDPNGRMTDEDTTPAGWRHIIPDTIAEDIYLALKSWLDW